MQIAAILTVDKKEAPRRFFPVAKRESPEAFSGNQEILGASLLDRALGTLRKLGTLTPQVLEGHNVSDQVLPSRSARSGSFIDAWERAISEYVNTGVETLLLIRVGTYADVDFSRLLSFHATERSPLTQVYGKDGSLDIAVVDARLLRNTDDLVRRALSNLIPRQKRFEFSGYVNRLRQRHDLHRLMQDGLHGNCMLRPSGAEMRPGVWHADGAEVDSSVMVTGPVFFGGGTRIAPGCVITGPTSIERDCQIDCGTAVEESLVLQGTYVGVALDVRRSIVGNETIFNLDRNVEVGVSDTRLIGRNTKSGTLLGSLTSFLRPEAQTVD